ncbi:BnaAnng17570D [Brassica napus]|uniref:BnaAnng17570D protein n=1 Tax=Brassica napus TaxID=3708 RepID=A0A078JBN3_BRANA|nr:BnaAnng17570D [Brassica napus]
MAAANAEDGVAGDLIYEKWAPTAKTTLVEKGLWDVVENGLSPDPTKIPELAATIKVADLAHWRNRVMRDIKALKILQASLPDSSFRTTISAASAKELWDSLAKGNEEAKLRRLEHQFEELSMCEKESIVSYFARVSRIVEELQKI